MPEVAATVRTSFTVSDARLEEKPTFLRATEPVRFGSLMTPQRTFRPIMALASAIQRGSIALSSWDAYSTYAYAGCVEQETIALKLVITESTAKVHMKAISRKLRLQNRTQAAMWARTNIDEMTLAAVGMVGPLEPQRSL
jgi:hypothetical protein